MKADNNAALMRHAEEIHQRLDLSEKTILDIGCGDGFMVKHIAEKYAPKYIYGIDMRLGSAQGERFSLGPGDARELPFEDNTFDIVCSISTFEHINGIKETLKEVRRVLKPYGKFHVAFAPVWTSICGHHCYSARYAFSDSCKQKGGDRDEKIVDAIPAWGHLYMNEDQMKEYLRKMEMQERQISAVIECIYHSDSINRCSASEVKSYLMNSGMIVRWYYEGVTFSRKWALDQKGPSELTDDIIKKVSNTKYNIFDLGIVYIKAELEKYESILI